MASSAPANPTQESGEEAGRGASWLLLALGPGLALVLYLGLGMFAPEMPESARRAAGLVVWMALWWITEALPLAVTSLLPLVLLPLLGITDLRSAASPYAERILFLFLGGFILALGMERWNLHRRIALHTVRVVGTRPDRLVGGFMLATAGLSMWMSNTATTMMMLPIAMSILALLEQRTGRPAGPMGPCLVLGVAYAASMGGIATPIGSPPNALTLGFLEQREGGGISFASWTLAAAPLMLAIVVCSWLAMTRWIFPVHRGESAIGEDTIAIEIRGLGPMSRGEAVVLGAFLSAIAGWILREPAKALSSALAGPESAVTRLVRAVDAGVDDASIALLAAIVLFAIPIDRERGVYVMDWRTAARLPWDVLLLFGGGLSLAAGVQASGLDRALGAALVGLNTLPAPLFMGLVLGASTFGSEVMSNVAQTNIFMPILGALADATGRDAAQLMFPACLALSCAFMMPMGTAPNALAFGSGRVTIRQMAWAGFWLNLICLALIWLHALLVVPLIIGSHNQGA